MEENEHSHLETELEIGNLKVNLVSEFPQSYSVDEMLRTANSLGDIDNQVDVAMHDDFVALPESKKDRLIGLLAEHSDKTKQWWRDYLS